VPIVLKSGSLSLLELSGPVQACNGIALHFFTMIELRIYKQNLSSSFLHFCGSGQLSQCSDWLRAGRSKDQIPVGERFFARVQTGPGAHPASCTMGTGSFLGVKSSRGVTLNSHPLLVPWSRKSRAILVLPLWAVQPVQSLSACTRVHFTFTFTLLIP